MLGRWLLLILTLSLFGSPILAQDQPQTADEVIDRYLHAIGAERFPSISTFEERGDISGKLPYSLRTYRPRGQSQNDSITFESFYKSPNLRYNSTITADNFVVSMHGCDGNISWHIDPFLKVTEFKPKPGAEYDCGQGFDASLLGIRREKVKLRFPKKKDFEGRAAWEVKVDDPRLPYLVNYYFDADTFLLLGIEDAWSKVSYTDYRDVGGMKFAFRTVTEHSGSKTVATVRELKINAPIDSARFIEPKPREGKIATNAAAPAQPNSPDNSKTAAVQASNIPNVSSSLSNPNAATPAMAGVTGTETPPSAVPARPVVINEVNFPNFTACTLAELQLALPDLKGLTPAPNQEELGALLDKMGAKTLDIARNTPNLIAREIVSEGNTGTPRDYDYLILTKVEGHVVALNEFRVDVKTGEKFETDALLKNDATAWAELEQASQTLSSSQSGTPPLSQGFATSWVHFYPTNRSEANFRYLGEQKLNGRRTLVVAFAQKPESVISPAVFRYRGKASPLFFQGVAWIDPSEYRIVRLRTDLLSPLSDVGLHRLTADIEFVPTKIEEVPTLLSLPRRVAVTSEFGESTLREIHNYSEYRLFRARSRIVVGP